MAAIGRAQLRRADALFAKRKEISSMYIEFMASDIGKKITPILKDVKGIVPHIFPCLAKTAADRDALRKTFDDNNIQYGFHYYPNHKLKYFSSDHWLLKESEQLASRQITLPLHGFNEKSIRENHICNL